MQWIVSTENNRARSWNLVKTLVLVSVLSDALLKIKIDRQDPRTWIQFPV
jgi:hypothetical protein